MPSNLSPGMSESDILETSQLYEKLFEQLPEKVQEEIVNDTKRGRKLDEQFQEYISRIFTEEDVLLEMQLLEAAPDDAFEDDE